MRRFILRYRGFFEWAVAALFCIALSILADWMSTTNKKEEYLRRFLIGVIGFIGLVLPLFAALYFRQVKSDRDQLKLQKSTANLEKVILQSNPNFNATEAKRFAKELWTWYKGQDSKFSSWELGARVQFAETYLETITNLLEDHTIRTTTDVFTDLYWDLTAKLPGTSLEDAQSVSKAPKIKKRITRVHLTGMLPEEFYNGPQLVYQEGEEAMPRIVSHMWEGYPGLYSHDPDRWPSLKLCRYVLVRSDSSYIREISALPTRTELNNQGKLVIDRNQRPFKDLSSECREVIERLTKKTGLATKNDHELRQFILQLLESEKFHYFPIVEAEDCETLMKCSPDMKWEPLLDVFQRGFHSDVGDARYCEIDKTMWNKISDTKHLKKCFQPGHTPEVVLYGDGEGKEWFFGLKGSYRSYTREIEITFLSGPDCARLMQEFNGVLKGTPGGNLSELRKQINKGCHVAGIQRVTS